LKLDSDVANLTTNGKFLSFNPLKYEFKDVRLHAALGEISRLFTPDLRLNGGATFTGEVEGKGDTYHAKGLLTAPSLNAAGFNATNLRVSNLDVNGKGATYTAGASVSASQIKNKDFQISSVQLNGANVKGKETAFDVTTQLTVTASKSGNI